MAMCEGTADAHWTNQQCVSFKQMWDDHGPKTDIGKVITMITNRTQHRVLADKIGSFKEELITATEEMLQDEDSVKDKLLPIFHKYRGMCIDFKTIYEKEVAVLKAARKQAEIAVREKAAEERKELESIVTRLENAIVAGKSPTVTRAIIEDLKANLSIDV